MDIIPSHYCFILVSNCMIFEPLLKWKQSRWPLHRRPWILSWLLLLLFLLAFAYNLCIFACMFRYFRKFLTSVLKGKFLAQGKCAISECDLVFQITCLEVRSFSTHISNMEKSSSPNPILLSTVYKLPNALPYLLNRKFCPTILMSLSIIS